MGAPSPRLWIGGPPIVLASRSEARKQMLTNAGVLLEVHAPEVDERAIEANLGSGSNPRALASLLARAKALDVSSRFPDRLVLGADQTLEFDGCAYAKVSERADARARLKMLSGQTHSLHSAYCFAQRGAVVRENTASADLAMRALSKEFLDAYLDEAGSSVLDSVGVYQVERTGIQLFEDIRGDWFAILGMPLRTVIEDLRTWSLLLK